MSTLLFYEPEQAPPTALDDLAAQLEAAGVVFSAPACTGYRPGHWHDPDTGAQATLDLGEPPLEQDDVHPPKSYLGWRSVALSLQIPLAAPHWHAVEALRWIEGWLSRIDELRALDCEDTRADDDAEPGPFVWNRLRLMASWERQHVTQTAERSDLARLERSASLALWRYRRERKAGRAGEPALIWPEALVLGEGRQARSVAWWTDPGAPFALPPVELLAVRRADGAGLLPADELATAAGGGEPLSFGAARRIRPAEPISNLFARAKLVPVTGFTALGDGDWSD